MSTPIKILACTKCGNTVKAITTGDSPKIVCPICDNDTFKSVNVPDEISCTYCKRKWKVEDILKMWNDIPFYDDKTKTFYDGCRGWD